MALYSVAPGHGVALLSLNVLVPQPQGGVVMPVQRNHSASGSIHEIGLYAELKWSYLPTPAAYLALLTQFGLHNALTASVTLYCRDARFAFTRYNGTAVLPQAMKDMRWAEYRPREIMILVKNLVAL